MVRGRLLAYAGLTVLLAAPRLVRMLYPQVWIEDDSYLHGAFLLARGFLPYRDFPLPHLPLLEAAMATVFLVAPISIRTAELFTQSAAFVGSLLVFAMGRRLDGPLVGGLAALLFATSSLLFRYHVFEREVFVVVPVLGAVLLLMRDTDVERSSSRGDVAAGVLLALAMGIKLTAAGAWFGVLVWLWLDGRRRAAVIVAAASAGIIVAVSVGLATWLGTDFIVQVFLFRVAHPTFSSIGEKLDELRYTTDISLAAGTGGVGLLLWRGEAWRWRAVLAQLACGFAFLVVLNPMYWAHTGIELLPWLSLPGGRLIAGAADALTSRHRRPELACLGAALALLLYVAPVRNLNWQAGDGSVYGFGYRDRSELEAVGAFVRAHSAPFAPVATPPILAFVANRPELIPYAEIAGTVDELTALVRREGSIAALRHATSRGESFWDTVVTSRDRLQPRLNGAIHDHGVAVVIDDSPADLLPVPLVDVSKETLERDGYSLESVSSHYDAWLPR